MIKFQVVLCLLLVIIVPKVIKAIPATMLQMSASGKPILIAGGGVCRPGQTTVQVSGSVHRPAGQQIVIMSPTSKTVVNFRGFRSSLFLFL